MIEVELFVDPAQDATTGEMRVKSNKYWNEVRYLATAFLVMKVRELPLKEVLTSVIAIRTNWHVTQYMPIRYVLACIVVCIDVMYTTSMYSILTGMYSIHTCLYWYVLCWY